MRLSLRIISSILLIISNLSCGEKESVETLWTGYGGALMLNITDEKFKINTIYNDLNNATGTLIGGDLFVLDSSDGSNDTLFLEYSSEDSLVIDMSKPRGLVLITLRPYIPPKLKIDSAVARRFIVGGDLNVTNKLAGTSQNAQFFEDGNAKIGNQNFTWLFKEFVDYLFLILSDDSGRKVFAKMVDFGHGMLRLEVYESSSDSVFLLEMEASK